MHVISKSDKREADLKLRARLVIVIGPSGVIARVVSKSDEREARGRFEITSTMTPCIVPREVQLLINGICKIFGIKNVF